VLVEGCNPVEFEATTQPLGLPVSWSIEPNENTSDAPLLTKLAGGRRARMATDRIGSFSVIATLGTSFVVFNLVLVGVKVDAKSTLVVTRNDRFADNGSHSTRTRFRSGDFGATLALGQLPWNLTVTATLVGGGTDGTLGVRFIRMQCIQNCELDDLTGVYAAGIGVELPDGGIPALDANSTASPYMVSPKTILITPSAKLTDKDTVRHVAVGDAPAGGFPNVHAHAKVPKGPNQLHEIAGSNQFLTAICSVSDLADTAIVVHAIIRWQTHYDGSVKYTSAGVGVYTPTKARTTGDARVTLVANASNGCDPAVIGIETFPPDFNTGLAVKWTP
jgi:hypothetical protein